MSYCPLTREKCRGIECAFWLNEIPGEGNKCAIYWIVLTFRAGLGELFSNPPELKACNEKVLQKLREKPVEEIAKEVLEFVKKNYPEALNSGYIPPEVFDYFWADKGIPPDILPFENPELYLTKMKVESIAKLSLKRILEKQEGIATEVKVVSNVENVHPSESALSELKEKSPEEIAEEIMQFIEKEFPEAIELGGGLHEAKTFFWMKKGLRAGCVEDPEINLKIRRAELLAEKKIKLRISGKEEITGKIPEEINNKSEEELANELVAFVRKEFPDDPSSSTRYLGRRPSFLSRTMPCLAASRANFLCSSQSHIFSAYSGSTNGSSSRPSHILALKPGVQPR
jgi:hypothetical protein